jgi:hypothetical protein
MECAAECAGRFEPVCANTGFSILHQGASVRAAPVPLSRSIKFPIFIFEKNSAHLSATWSAENLSPVTKRVGCKARSAFGSNGR